MTLSLTSALSLFFLILLSTALFFVAKRFKLPYTVLLLLVGILIVPLVSLPGLSTVFGWLGDMVLTPELLFFIFLPVLIFESGFNMNVRKMMDSIWSISLLSIVGVIVSMIIIAVLLYFLLPFVGVEIPFILALMFGAIISAVDPVAVISLFKETNAPKRLTMIFEGESLLNDATAVALFFILLAVAMGGFDGAETFLFGLVEFTIMIVGGLVIGLIMAALFSRAMKLTRSNNFVTVTLLVISAHMVFIITEVLNELTGIHMSAIMATAVASLFLGNYSRSVLPPKLEEYSEKLIEHMTFVANSLVFLMAGLLFANSGVDVGELWLPILVTILVVAFARWVMIYAITTPINKLKLEGDIPSSWQKLLSWASLRGALAIVIVLIVPEDFSIEGWALAYSPRDFLLALAIGCILATMFIKAPLIAPLIRRYRLDQPEPLKLAHEADLGIYYLLTEKNRLLRHKTKGFVDERQFEMLLARVEGRLRSARRERDTLADVYGKRLFDQSLHLAAIHIEGTTLKRLYINNEVSERTFRKLHSKLNLQTEKIEQARHDEIDPSLHTDRKDVFDWMVDTTLKLTSRTSREERLEDTLQYYRAQMIMARKAAQGLSQMQEEYDESVFIETAYDRVVARYNRYKKENAVKVDTLLVRHKEELSLYLSQLAKQSLQASGARALHFLHEQGLVDESAEQVIEKRFKV